MAEPVECAGIAMISGGRVFLVRPFYNFIPQSLAIPKGHIEAGETSRQCAIREFTEETGIPLDVDPQSLEFLTCAKTRTSNGGLKKVYVYVLKGDGSETFVSSVRFDNGAPENLYGEYVDFDSAEELITSYQKCIVSALKKREMESFDTFYGDRI